MKGRKQSSMLSKCRVTDKMRDKIKIYNFNLIRFSSQRQLACADAKTFLAYGGNAGESSQI